jgi:hypothetical protein
MKQNHKFEEIEKYLFYKANLVTLDSNFLKIGENKIDLGENFAGSIYLHNKESIIVQSFYGNFIIFTNYKIVDSVEGYYILSRCTTGPIYFSENSEIKTLENSEIKTTPFSQNGYITDLYFINLLEENNVLNRLFKFYLKSGQFLSSFPLSKLGTYNHGAGEQPYKVALFAGMYQNTLVCTVQWGGVLLLDVQTGEAIKFLKEAPAVYYLYPSAVDSPVYWSLEYTKFAEIDVAKAEILRDIELRPQLDAMAIQYGIQAGMLDIVTSVCYDGIIYFIAGGYFLGVFDPVSATIIDHHYFKFHKNGHRLRSGKEFLQVQGKEIYILDTEGTLHVMERE